MPETSQSIRLWADETFGPVGDLQTLTRRALLEFEELSQALAAGDADEARREAADVVILLHRLSALVGGDLGADVDAKMAINRARTWVADGTGVGRHV